MRIFILIKFFVVFFLLANSEAMFRNLQKLNAISKAARASICAFPTSAVPTKLAKGQRKAMFSSDSKWPIGGGKASKIGDMEKKMPLAAVRIDQQRPSSPSSSSSSEELSFASKFLRKKLSSRKSAIEPFPTDQKMHKNQIKENEQNSSNGILVLGPQENFSSEKDSDKLIKFITNGQKNVAEIRGEKGVKYSDNFFDKLITAVLHAQPEALPKIFLRTAAATKWTKVFDFVEEFDGASCRANLDGANFECAAEHYVTSGQNAFTEYLMRREDAEGQFVFRFYHPNLDKNEHPLSYGEGNKFVAIEIFTRRKDF